jgi:putative spermidine/putrescine transport system permease protein
VEAADALTPQPKRSVSRRLAGLFHGRPRLQIGSLLAAPVGWLVIGYLGSLAVLLATGFWSLGELSGEVERNFTLDNFSDIVTEPVYRSIIGRTVLIALLVTLTDILLALPLAFFMAKVARRSRGLLVIAVLVPLWSSYLVKVYAWKTILAEDGAFNWALEPLGIHSPYPGSVAVWLVMSYIWLPYMIIPIYAALDRMPDSLLSASEDLGAHPGTTFRRVIFPLIFPAIVAGSIFTFALTLGDYITPQLVSKTQFIGNVVYSNFSTDLPFAAAFATVPIVIMIIYLLLARRAGAFEHV